MLKGRQTPFDRLSLHVCECLSFLEKRLFFGSVAKVWMVFVVTLSHEMKQYSAILGTGRYKDQNDTS